MSTYDLLFIFSSSSSSSAHSHISSSTISSCCGRGRGRPPCGRSSCGGSPPSGSACGRVGRGRPSCGLGLCGVWSTCGLPSCDGRLRGGLHSSPLPLPLPLPLLSSFFRSPSSLPPRPGFFTRLQQHRDFWPLPLPLSFNLVFSSLC